MAPRRESRLSSFGPPEREPDAARAEEPPALSVTTLLGLVQRTLQDDTRFSDVWVRGEVSGFRPASSGHWYFDLKDAGGVLKTAMFRADNARVRFQLEDGMEVLVRGRVGIYPAKSDLQLVGKEMKPVGQGALALAFEQMKRKLEAEGLFAAQRKRAVPRYPARVGVVTSLQGAVLRDIVQTAKRRSPSTRLLVVGARVQGEGAAESIARGIERLNAARTVDVIIVARGGGSAEDLWCFNEERVVRAVVASAVPVVSAVGHETDFTLCDFAADERASTPTAAAERLTPDAGALLAAIGDREVRLGRALGALVPTLHQEIDDTMERAAASLTRRIAREGDVLAQKAARLQTLSPLATLARGYAVVRKGTDVIRSVRKLKPGDDVEILLSDGALDAKITRKKVKDDGEEG